MKLIKLLSDHYIIVDDSEIKEGDIFLHPDNVIERASRDLDGRGIYKIIASTNKLNSVIFLNLSEVKQLLGEVDVRKKSDEYSKYETPDLDNDYLIGVSEGQIDGYTAGYNQALEDNKERKYTEKDVIAIVEKSRATGLTAEYIIQSLQPPTSWDIQFVNGKLKLI